ncbi:MAG: MoxR family ATPase [Actinobacteria bacterium]|nr:MoxR family ATPase [Actinomycetota bacterium]
MDLRQTTSAMESMVASVERVIMGKREAVELAVCALFAGVHLLIEDVPGVGKTMLARSIAKSIDASFKRIQGTSDLLPSDITGATVYDQQTHTFNFVPGPVFANVVLFDEINRTGPKTQSALLEVMDEGSVSAEGNVYELPRPFFVAATRNPVEHHGTFPLPEGELDRFGVSLQIGYPDAGAERDVVARQLVTHPLEELEPVLSPEEVVAHQHAVRTVHIDRSVLEYLIAIVRATREQPEVSLGASPRGSVSLSHVGQSYAALHGRDFVTPDDVKHVAPAVLAHRVLLTGEVGGTADAAREVVMRVLRTLDAPVFSGRER